ncbi:Glycosyltransferase involved in cell wall biogenesis [mine drainage metagenome]|uniref:Glycosyltransferase involved in cell wall biogenesis n=1 Tax=mine drainage metagenome TaxID=410659 RepID=T1C636_9ZZZZ
MRWPTSPSPWPNASARATSSRCATACAFLLIIFKIATLYSPLKLFLPVSALFFVLGLINYLHTYIDTGRLTNMSTLLWSAAVIVFLIGLISEQITNLTYKREG